MQFHDTGYGRKFFGCQLPSIMKSLQDISIELKRSNDLKDTKKKDPMEGYDMSLPNEPISPTGRTRIW